MLVPFTSSQYITMMVNEKSVVSWCRMSGPVSPLNGAFFLFFVNVFINITQHITWHILGDRLIPEQLLWVDRGVLHVGPAKSLAFSRGPKGCHDNFKRCGLSWIIIATILTWVTSSPWLVGLFFGDDILPSYIPGLCHKPWNQDPYNHGYSTNPPLTYPPRNKGLIRPY